MSFDPTAAQVERRRKTAKRNGAKKIGCGKGYYFHSTRQKWYASICINGKRHNLGYHQTEDEAAIAYNKAYANRENMK